jgi:hypothetical protein
MGQIAAQFTRDCRPSITPHAQGAVREVASVSGRRPVASRRSAGLAPAEVARIAGGVFELDHRHLTPGRRLVQQRTVSDLRTHRGPHPRDAELFRADRGPVLQTATSELSWLLSRGYGNPSALKLVGDRHDLVLRQREAVMRSSCSDAALERRRGKLVSACAGETLWIDGLNVILTTEVALGGGVVLLGRDGCARDLASVHGTYRRVEETRPALDVIGAELHALGVKRVCVVLDSPVSNTRKLAGLIRETWSGEFDLQIQLEHDADRVLVEEGGVVASADGEVLDHCAAWVNLARRVVSRVSPVWALDLGTTPVADARARNF